MTQDLFIDLGSSYIKWRVGNGAVKRVAFPKEAKLSPPYFEVPADKIKDKVLAIVDSSSCRRIFMSVQMHGYVLLDSLGREITNYISWQDRRSEGMDIPIQLVAENGVSLKPNLPRASLYAMSLRQPEIYGRAHTFCTLGSYLTYILTGVNMTHITDAASSGFYNVITCEGKSSLQLPQATKTVRLAGKYKDMLVYTPVGDQQAAVLGCGAGEESYVMNLGTAGQLCCVNSSFIHGDYESRPYFGGKTLCTVSRLMAGRELVSGSDHWVHALYEDYYNALQKLPVRKDIVVTGGAAKFFRPQLIRAIERMGLPYTFNENMDALEGLRILSEDDCDAKTSRHYVV